MAKTIEEQSADFMTAAKKAGRDMLWQMFKDADLQTKKKMIEFYSDLKPLIDGEKTIDASTPKPRLAHIETQFSDHVRIKEGANGHRIFQGYGSDRVVIEGGSSNTVRQGAPLSAGYDMAYFLGGDNNTVTQGPDRSFASIAGGIKGKLNQGRGNDLLEITGGEGYAIHQGWGDDVAHLIGGKDHVIHQDAAVGPAGADRVIVDSSAAFKTAASVAGVVLSQEAARELALKAGVVPTNNTVYQGGGNDVVEMRSWAGTNNIFDGGRGVDTIDIRPEDLASLRVTKQKSDGSIVISHTGMKTENKFLNYEQIRIGEKVIDLTKVQIDDNGIMLTALASSGTPAKAR